MWIPFAGVIIQLNRLCKTTVLNNQLDRSSVILRSRQRFAEHISGPCATVYCVYFHSGSQSSLESRQVWIYIQQRSVVFQQRANRVGEIDTLAGVIGESHHRVGFVVIDKLPATPVNCL